MDIATSRPWLTANMGLTAAISSSAPRRLINDQQGHVAVAAHGALVPRQRDDPRAGFQRQAQGILVDLKVVSSILGHSTISLTADTYAGVLDNLTIDAADRLARMLPAR